MEPEILYETENIVAINKPAGLVVHYDGKTKEPTVVDWVEKTYPESCGVGEPLTLSTGEVIQRSGIVHRLDRDTSGILLVARTQEAYEFLKRQFKDGTIKKTYRAFVYGKIDQNRGNIRRPIGRSQADFRKFSAAKRMRGNEREAETVYNVIQTTPEVTYINALPQTGRTHQIRVHMLAIHHPVVCDSLYAPKKECILGFNRLALHAYTISFKDIDGTERTIEAPLPSDFLKAEEALKSCQ